MHDFFHSFLFTNVKFVLDILLWREENGNPLQYSCLENLMDIRACQTTVHGTARVGHDLATKPPPPPSFYSQPN